jgi:hypothetical protein
LQDIPSCDDWRRGLLLMVCNLFAASTRGAVLNSPAAVPQKMPQAFLRRASRRPLRAWQIKPRLSDNPRGKMCNELGRRQINFFQGATFDRRPS